MIQAEVHQRTLDDVIELEDGRDEIINFDNYVIRHGKARNISEAYIKRITVPPYTDVKITPTDNLEIATKIHNGTENRRSIKLSNIGFKAINSSSAVRDGKFSNNKLIVLLIPILCQLFIFVIIAIMIIVIVKLVPPTEANMAK
jgi:hypothetical protein